MSRLQTIISHGAGCGEADVNDRRPPLERVMAIVVEQIRHADGCGCPRRFDHSERRVIIDDVVGQQDFLAAAATHVQRREIIERSRRADAGEEQIVGRIPESMHDHRLNEDVFA